MEKYDTPILSYYTSESIQNNILQLFLTYTISMASYSF